MSVTIISKRTFKLDKKDKMIPLLLELRKHAKKQKGFVSRAAYQNINDPGEYLVISVWKTVNHWSKWMKKKKTGRIQGDIDSLIGEKTIFDVYEPDVF